MKRQELPIRPSRYRSYVVRCWQERSVQAAQEILVWRFSLEDASTNQRRGFATLEGLLLFLQADLVGEPPE